MSNPTFNRDYAMDLLNKNLITDKVVLIGYRSVTSKYGQYDDTLAIVTPDQYLEFKGNTLPSKWQPGIGKLMPGVYDYRKGLHGISHLNTKLPEDEAIYAWLESHVEQDHPPVIVNGVARILPYWAGRQAGPIMVIRDGEDTAKADGWPGNPDWCDIHHGGWNGTSSLMCQTLFPDHWIQFRHLLYSSMDQEAQEKVKYTLIQLAA